MGKRKVKWNVPIRVTQSFVLAIEVSPDIAIEIAKASCNKMAVRLFMKPLELDDTEIPVKFLKVKEGFRYQVILKTAYYNKFCYYASVAIYYLKYLNPKTWMQIVRIPN